MNPLTNMKNVLKLSEQELERNSKSSWHDQYKDSAWIFVGGLPYELSEGDIICIFSQYGEIVNINLVRAKDTGKSKGFCFICYEDQRSTILAVDNFNGIKIMNRTIRVDHVAEYKVPKEYKNIEVETKKLYNEGCAPKMQVAPIMPSPPRDFRETIADQIEAELKLPARLPIYSIKSEEKEEAKTDKPEVKKEKLDAKKDKADAKKEKADTKKEKADTKKAKTNKKKRRRSKAP